MRKALLFLAAIAAFAALPAQSATDASTLVLVKGGPFKNARSNYYGQTTTANPYVGRLVTVPDFFIGKYEVTQKEWNDVMGSNPSHFKGETLPVESVSWYDCIEYCNRRSEKEGLKPYYTIDRAKKDPGNLTQIDDVKWAVTINAGANGYRLPTETEWEYAATGGQLSKNFRYSGGDDLDQVGWYWANAGDKKLDGPWLWNRVDKNHCRTHPVGEKAPNELGLYDLSGNVREWCWDWYGELGTSPRASSIETGRVWRGGGWMGVEECCEPSYRANYEACGKGSDQGLRVCRKA